MIVRALISAISRFATAYCRMQMSNCIPVTKDTRANVREEWKFFSYGWGVGWLCEDRETVSAAAANHFNSPPLPFSSLLVHAYVRALHSKAKPTLVNRAKHICAYPQSQNNPHGEKTRHSRSAPKQVFVGKRFRVYLST